MQSRRYGFEAQARSKLISFIVFTLLLLIFAASVQTALLARFLPMGATPDLMICIVLCVAYFNGRYAGAVTGIAAGVLIEAIGSEGVVLLPMIYLFLGYVVGHYARAVQPKRYLTYLFYLACTLAVRAATTMLYAALCYDVINIPQILLHAVFPEFLTTAVTGAVLYLPMMLFCKKIKI